jgi:large subunit ribosomal protein L13
MKIINGNGLLLGRLASEVAKGALLGEEYAIVNCEQVVVSGDKRKIFKREYDKRQRKGYPLKSAKLPRRSDLFVRRVIRGMLPYDKGRGREAFKRITCYVDVPKSLSEGEPIEHAHVKKLPTLRYTTVGDICRHLGGKV